MKIYIESTMGAAGDMLTGALLELTDNPKAFIERINSIGLKDVKVEYKKTEKCGILGTSVDVYINGEVEEEHHHHHHMHIGDINVIIENLNVSDSVKKNAAAVYDILAQAESAAHGTDVSHIHFHEVGAMDAVADIVGVCMLIEEIAPEKIVASSVNTGFGTVKCAHGILPVPAPATAHILKGVPTYRGDIMGELCTPTGAALIKYFADEFCDNAAMTVDKIGYGMGKRSFVGSDGAEVLCAVRVMKFE